MGDASSIRAGGAVVEIGAKDISLKGQLDKAAKQLQKFEAFAATLTNRVATNIAVMGARAKMMAGKMKSAFAFAGKAVSLFFAPLKLLGKGVAWVGQQALSLASSLASIAWTQFKRGVLAATATLAAALKVFADFQTQLAMVNTMLGGGAGSSGAMLEEFGRELRQLSIDMGESTSTLAKGLYDILSASIPAEHAMRVLAVSARAAKAGLTDTGTAADTITTILNSFGLAADKAGDVADLLFAIVKRGKTTFAELAGTIGLVATTAASAGITLDEMGAALATMTRNGVRTENAVTALQAIISSFLKPTDEAVETARNLDSILRGMGVDTLKLRKRLKEMGIETKTLGFEMNSTTLRSEGLRGVLTRIASLPPDVISKLFPNIRALRGVLPALKNMAGFTEDLAAMAGRAGSTEEAFEKMTNTISFGFNRAKQAFLGLLTTIGEMFEPVFSEALDTIIQWVEGAREWLETYSDDFEWYINDAWEGAKEIFGTAWAWIRDNVLSLIGEDFDTAFENIKAAARTFWETMKTIWDTGVSVITAAVDIVKMFFEDPAEAGRMVAEAFNKVWAIAAGAIDFAGGSGILDKLAVFFGGLVDRLRETGFVEKMMTLIADVFKLTGKLWAAAYKWAKTIGQAILEGLLLAWEGGEIEGLSPETLRKAGERGIELGMPGQPSVLPEGGVSGSAVVTGGAPAAQRMLGHRPGDIVTAGGFASQKGLQQNIQINVRNPLDPRVTEGIDRNLTRLKNRGRGE